MQALSGGFPAKAQPCLKVALGLVGFDHRARQVRPLGDAPAAPFDGFVVVEVAFPHFPAAQAPHAQFPGVEARQPLEGFVVALGGGLLPGGHRAVVVLGAAQFLAPAVVAAAGGGGDGFLPAFALLDAGAHLRGTLFGRLVLLHLPDGLGRLFVAALLRLAEPRQRLFGVLGAALPLEPQQTQVVAGGYRPQPGRLLKMLPGRGSVARLVGFQPLDRVGQGGGGFAFVLALRLGRRGRGGLWLFFRLGCGRSLGFGFCFRLRRRGGLGRLRLWLRLWFRRRGRGGFGRLRLGFRGGLRRFRRRGGRGGRIPGQVVPHAKFPGQQRARFLHAAPRRRGQEALGQTPLLAFQIDPADVITRLGVALGGQLVQRQKGFFQVALDELRPAFGQDLLRRFFLAKQSHGPYLPLRVARSFLLLLS